MKEIGDLLILRITLLRMVHIFLLFKECIHNRALADAEVQLCCSLVMETLPYAFPAFHTTSERLIYVSELEC